MVWRPGIIRIAPEVKVKETMAITSNSTLIDIARSVDSVKSFCVDLDVRIDIYPNCSDAFSSTSVAPMKWGGDGK